MAKKEGVTDRSKLRWPESYGPGHSIFAKGTILNKENTNEP